MEAAIATIAHCREEAGKLKQTKMFDAYVGELQHNAKAAENWLLKAGQAYPRRCGADGKPI